MKHRRNTEYACSWVTITDKNGRNRTYSRCNLCGKWHNEAFGITMSFRLPRWWGGQRTDLCAKCAGKILPHFEKFMDAMGNAENVSEDVSPVGKKCREKLNTLFAMEMEIYGKEN